MKKLIVVVLLVFIFCGIGTLFWYNELVYQLPTPVPENYRPIANGKLISLKELPGNYTGKPVFLHFFNPDCPCSRFNIAHFKTLAKRYASQVNFVVVVMNNDYYTARQIQDKFGLDIPVVFAPSLAAATGVYSTPQAVILTAGHQLYYRGNYNASRYCTDEKTSYAKIALNGLLNNQAKLAINPLAMQAYGCRLPNCDK